MSLIAAGTVVLEQGPCRPGWVETSAGRIVDCGSGLPPRQADVDMPDALVVPGFVDIHVHGGGGASYIDGNDADTLRAVMFHRPAEDPGRHEDRRRVGGRQRAPEFVEFDGCPLPK